MSRFRDELRIIPGIAWVIAGLSFVFVEVLMWQLAFPGDSDLKNGPFLVRLCISILAATVLPAYVLLVGYVSRDAARRGMRQALWTLIAIFVPNCIGIILYFVMREPLMACCPKCGTPTKSTFAFCNQCGTEISQACPHCRRPVEAGWKACAYCGCSLVGGAPGAIEPGNPTPNPNPVG
jgi:Double zinc ribbon